MVYKFKKSFSENIRIKSLTCLKHQINIIVVIFVLWKFLPSNQSFEQMGVLKILIYLEVCFKQNPQHKTCGSIEINELYCG